MSSIICSLDFSFKGRPGPFEIDLRGRPGFLTSGGFSCSFILGLFGGLLGLCFLISFDLGLGSVLLFTTVLFGVLPENFLSIDGLFELSFNLDGGRPKLFLLAPEEGYLPTLFLFVIGASTKGKYSGLLTELVTGVSF
jgi:hypothetical protein